jgi:hypothetical protein
MAEEGKTRRPTGSSRKPASNASGTRKAAAKKPASTAKKPASAKKTTAAGRKPASTARKATARKTAAKPASGAKPAAKKPAAKKPKATASPGSKGDGSKPESRKKEMPPASETPAPSIGPHTEIEHEEPEERLARHEQSDTDAMGLDKRRAVVGGSYSPSVARQATLYGVFIAVIVALAIGFKLLADKLDEPPANSPDQAPWSQPGSPQIPAKQPE